MNLGVLTWVVPDGGFGVLRRRFEEAFDRLGTGVWPILQTAVAASLAWFLASAVLGHGQPFFAAIAAVISTGVVVGREGSGRRARVSGRSGCVADLLVGASNWDFRRGLRRVARRWRGSGGGLPSSPSGGRALHGPCSTLDLRWSRSACGRVLGAGWALGLLASPQQPGNIVERCAPSFATLLASGGRPPPACRTSIWLSMPSEGARDGWKHGRLHGSPARGSDTEASPPQAIAVQLCPTLRLPTSGPSR